MVDVQTPLRIAVVGGSIGGLTAALVLREQGHEVDVYERIPAVLDSRGAGIVLQPDTMRWFERSSRRSVETISTSASRIRYIGDGDTVVHEEPASWRFTSWGAICRPLLEDFGTARYHLGEEMVDLDQVDGEVRLRFRSGTTCTADLAVLSDGISSTARRCLLPDVTPRYAGYVGWRGTVTEDGVAPQTRDLLWDALGYAVAEAFAADGGPQPVPGQLEAWRSEPALRSVRAGALRDRGGDRWLTSRSCATTSWTRRPRRPLA